MEVSGYHRKIPSETGPLSASSGKATATGFSAHSTTSRPGRNADQRLVRREGRYAAFGRRLQRRSLRTLPHTSGPPEITPRRARRASWRGIRPDRVPGRSPDHHIWDILAGLDWEEPPWSQTSAPSSAMANTLSTWSSTAAGWNHGVRSRDQRRGCRCGGQDRRGLPRAAR